MAVSNLSPYQLAIQNAVGKGKGAGANLTSDMAGRIADQVFGPAPITPGSRIVYQDAANVHWIDPEGYEHTANAQALADQQGQLVAQLYGNRVNQSSIANDAGARFAQYSGLVKQQQQ